MKPAPTVRLATFTTPRRVSLVEQAAEAISQQISHQQWRDFLPPEHTLTKELGISRVTLRKALTELVAQGWIQMGGRGFRHKIIWRDLPGSPVTALRKVRCLSPIADTELVASTRVILDEIRAALLTHGADMEFEHRKSLWQGKPAGKLAKLAADGTATAWLLYRSTLPMQRWCQEHQVPCVVLGPCHQSVVLPSVELDVTALGHHAGAEIARLGHAHVLYVAYDLTIASSLHTLDGLRQQLLPQGKLTKISLCADDDTVNGLRTNLRAIFTQPHPPTCILTSAAGQAWPIIGILQEIGLRVPTDVSLVVRDHESFLTRSVPEVTRYTFDAPRIGRLAASLLRDVMAGASVRHSHRKLIPKFIPGKTLTTRNPKR